VRRLAIQVQSSFTPFFLYAFLPLRLSSFTSFAPAFRENDVFIAVFRKAARKSGIEKTLAK
jgi:hypothetical protein